MSKTVVVLTTVLVALSRSFAQDYIPLWPVGKMPNSKGIALRDSLANDRIYQVSRPELWAYRPCAEENKGTAVIIIPGGGYARLAYQKSGISLAKWFNTMGVSAFVLIYRLPHSPDLIDRTIGPLQDAQRAVRVVRARASEWGLAPDRIGVLGTSAGGHLATTLGTYKKDVAAIGDSMDRMPVKADFMILVSPVIDLGRYAHAGSRNNLLGPAPSADLVARFSNHLQVSSATPPTFIIHAVNDKTVPLMNSVMFHRALVDRGVSASFHVFPQGAHSIALRDNPGSTELWTMLCEAWLKEMGFIQPPR